MDTAQVFDWPVEPVVTLAFGFKGGRSGVRGGRVVFAKFMTFLPK